MNVYEEADKINESIGKIETLLEDDELREAFEEAIDIAYEEINKPQEQ